MEINAFLETLAPADRGKVVVFHNAVVKCTRAYQEDPTETKLRNLRAAEQALAAEIERLQPVAAAGQDQEEGSDLFASRLEAWQYLQDSGWRIGRSQFYQHCKEGRLLLDRKTGKYLQAAVDKYAQLHCRLAETGEKVNDKRDRLAENKAEVEFEREKIRLQKEQHDLAVRLGEYVPRDQVELMIVGRAVALLAHLKALVQMQSGDWIELVEGKPERAQELIGTVNRAVEEHLSVFARDIEFDVIFEKNDKNDTEEQS